MLLRLLSVGSEGVGQSAGGGGRVGVRRVVNLCASVRGRRLRLGLEVTNWRGWSAFRGSGSWAGAGGGGPWWRSFWMCGCGVLEGWPGVSGVGAGSCGLRREVARQAEDHNAREGSEDGPVYGWEECEMEVRRWSEVRAWWERNGRRAEKYWALPWFPARRWSLG